MNLPYYLDTAFFDKFVKCYFRKYRGDFRTTVVRRRYRYRVDSPNIVLCFIMLLLLALLDQKKSHITKRRNKNHKRHQQQQQEEESKMKHHDYDYRHYHHDIAARTAPIFMLLMDPSRDQQQEDTAAPTRFVTYEPPARRSANDHARTHTSTMYNNWLSQLTTLQIIEEALSIVSSVGDEEEEIDDSSDGGGHMPRTTCRACEDGRRRESYQNDEGEQPESN
jgi:hypothetical protein